MVFVDRILLFRSVQKPGLSKIDFFLFCNDIKRERERERGIKREKREIEIVRNHKRHIVLATDIPSKK